MSTKHIVTPVEIEEAFSSLLDVVNEDTAALVLNHLELSRQAAEFLMQRQSRELAGERYNHDKPHDGRYSRWGSNPGSVSVGGQKLRVSVPRLHDNTTGATLSPEVYGQLREIATPPVHVMQALLRGLGTRRYRETAEVLLESFGLSKSTLSEAFVEHSREILEEFLNRRLDDEQYVAMFIDGKVIQDQSIILAIGVTDKGYKRMLGLTQATTENATAISVMLRDMVARGLEFEQGLLVVIDGGTGLRKAIEDVFGHYAVVQRCQEHKKRNVLDHLSEAERSSWRKKLATFFRCEDYREAQAMADQLHTELDRVSLPAARSFTEGLQDMHTLVRLGVARVFAHSFATTNIIESANSSIAAFTRHITRWTTADQRMRWTALAVLQQEPHWNRVRNYLRLPMLQRAVQQEINRRILESTAGQTPKGISTRKRT